jgi:hypothetical protein
MSPDAIQVAFAGAVTLVTSLLALRAGSSGAPSDADHTIEAPATETAAPTAAVTPAVTHTPGSPTRPRILTGEPVAAEQPKPVPRRALKLVAGIGVLAVAGAFGLLAFVRALISMFDSIGG